VLHNVLVCLDGSQGYEAQRTCQAVAFEFARKYQARLIGLHVRPLPPPIAPAMAAPAVALGASMAIAAMEASARAAALDDREEQQRAEAFADEFLEAAARAGVEATCHTVRGDLVDQVVQYAHAADLVLLPDALARQAPAWPVARIVRSVARPVLLASQAAVPIKRIAVAYDGSLGSDRALQAAVDMAINWPEPRPDIVLLAVTANTGDRAAVLAPAEQYVRGYDLRYRTHVAQGAPARRICAAAAEEEARLLCMGAYGHSRLREALLGGAIDEVVKHRHQALLLVH
jgi:nucleotide-binding universal stress UspA family protein